MDYSTVETTANVREWQYLTGRDFEAMDRARTVVLVTCSPLEVHGPHLPVVTDNVEGEGLSLRVAEKLNERHPELEFLHLPPIYVASDVVPQRGSVMFRSSTITRVMEDLGRSLARQGFRHIWVSGFHGGPRHFVPIELAADRVNRRYGVQMVSVFSLLVNRLTNGGSDLTKVLKGIRGLGVEDLVGDTHGGLIETSLMLHLLGEHVRDSYRDLEQVTVDQWVARRGRPKISQDSVMDLLRGFREKIKYYEDETYAGKPAAASPELGAEILERLSELAAQALDELYTGSLPESEWHSPLWKVRWLFTTPAVGWAFERAVQYRQQVF